MSFVKICTWVLQLIARYCASVCSVPLGVDIYIVKCSIFTLKCLRMTRPYILSSCVLILSLCYYRLLWRTLANTTKLHVNKTLKHYLNHEHFFLSHIAETFMGQWWLFNNKDKNRHDRALLASLVLFLLREPSRQKIHEVCLMCWNCRICTDTGQQMPLVTADNLS